MRRLVDDRMIDIKALGHAAVAGSTRLLFPPVCAGCRNLVSEPGTLCGACWPKLTFLEPPWCAVLGTPFATEMGEGALSTAAIASPPPFDRARAAVAYSGVARRMVQGLKFQDRTDLAPWMARWMRRAGIEVLADADLILPVPLHRRRFLARRFNQSAELGRAIARLSGLPMDAGMLERSRMTRQQVGLAARERLANVRGAFRVTDPDRLRGRRVLLIDDVYTTGATVSAAARMLRRKGAAKVDVLTFARVLPGDFQPEDAETI